MTRRLRILHLISGLLPGGAERVVLDLIAASDPARLDSKLVSMSDRLDALAAYGREATPVEIADPRRAPLRLRRIIAQFDPDIIHAHMFHAGVAACLLGAGRRVVFTSHSFRMAPLRKRVIRALRGRRACDILFAHDQHPEMNAASVEDIPNGVALPAAPARREGAWGPRCVALGRLSAPKDPVGLIRGFAAAALPDATLEIIGAGELEAACRAEIAARGLAGRVTLPGFSRNPRAALRRADVFLMHSRWEGMPMALLEAGAEGLPCLSTPAGTAPQILAEGRGLIATPAEFPAALRALAADPAAARAMGARLAAHVAAHHSTRAVADAHARLYARLCA